MKKLPLTPTTLAYACISFVELFFCIECSEEISHVHGEIDTDSPTLLGFSSPFSSCSMVSLISSNSSASFLSLVVNDITFSSS